MSSCSSVPQWGVLPLTKAGIPALGWVVMKTNDTCNAVTPLRVSRLQVWLAVLIAPFATDGPILNALSCFIRLEFSPLVRIRICPVHCSKYSPSSENSLLDQNSFWAQAVFISHFSSREIVSQNLRQLPKSVRNCSVCGAYYSLQ